MSIKKSKLVEIFGEEYYEQELSGKLEVSFRECIDGEEEYKDRC